MNRLLLVLFVSGSLFCLMALMPEGQKESREAMSYDVAVERAPSAIPYIPPSGEPSDNGLTQSLHRDFRETLNRNPAAAVVLARQYVFTVELDMNFRLEILRDLKEIQFTEPSVFELAGEIIDKNREPRFMEEALNIKSAILSEEEFSALLSEVSGRADSPELLEVIRKF